MENALKLQGPTAVTVAADGGDLGRLYLADTFVVSTFNPLGVPKGKPAASSCFNLERFPTATHGPEWLFAPL